MAVQKTAALFLMMLFVHRLIPTTALSKLQAITSTDGLHRQAPTAPANYLIGGGYTTPSGRYAEDSCLSVGLEEITTFDECQSAAKQVGIANIEMVGPGSWKHVPYGCTVLQGRATPESGAVGTSGRVHFSNTSGDNNGGNGGYVLICKQALVVFGASTRRIALFSAQFGGRDRVQYRIGKDSSIEDMGDVGLNAWDETAYRFSEKLPDSVDAFIFTDMVNVVRKPNSQWKFVYPARHFEEMCDDNVLCKWKGNTTLTQSQKKMQSILAAKFFKTRFIAENTQYDYIVWVDGKYLVRNQWLPSAIHGYMKQGVDMLAMRHPQRSTVAEELGPASERAALILGDDSVIQRANKTYKRYQREGFSDTTGLFDSAMFIVRPARVHDMFVDWWHEVQQGVPRDQISLPWMIQKHGINVSTIGPNACAVLGKHCRNPNAHNE